jgi:hypothetical protein
LPCPPEMMLIIIRNKKISFDVFFNVQELSKYRQQTPKIKILRVWYDKNFVTIAPKIMNIKRTREGQIFPTTTTKIDPFHEFVKIIFATFKD